MTICLLPASATILAAVFTVLHADSRKHGEIGAWEGRHYLVANGFDDLTLMLRNNVCAAVERMLDDLARTLIAAVLKKACAADDIGEDDSAVFFDYAEG